MLPDNDDEYIRELKEEVASLRKILEDEPDGTPIRIIEAMFDYAEKLGHPKYSSRHALGFIMRYIDTLIKENKELNSLLER